MPFYGNLKTPSFANRAMDPIDLVHQMAVPIQGHYSKNDPEIPLEQLGKFEHNLRARGVEAQLFTYDAAHGFFAYTRSSYNAEAAQLALGAGHHILAAGSECCMRSLPPKKETTMRNEQAATETKGVTVTLLAALDLGPEIEGMAGRQLRMRMVTIEPGGVFGPIHDHQDRPGLVYILQGTITDHRDGVSKEYGPGVGWPEDRSTTHWLENRGTTPAAEISVDIVTQR